MRYRPGPPKNHVGYRWANGAFMCDMVCCLPRIQSEIKLLKQVGACSWDYCTEVTDHTAVRNFFGITRVNDFPSPRVKWPSACLTSCQWRACVRLCRQSSTVCWPEISLTRLTLAHVSARCHCFLVSSCCLPRTFSRVLSPYHSISSLSCYTNCIACFIGELAVSFPWNTACVLDFMIEEWRGEAIQLLAALTMRTTSFSMTPCPYRDKSRSRWSRCWVIWR